MRKEWSDKKWIWHTMRFCLKTGCYYGIRDIADFNSLFGLRLVKQMRLTVKNNNYVVAPTGKMEYSRHEVIARVDRGYKRVSEWDYFTSSAHNNCLAKACREWREEKYHNAMKANDLIKRNEAYRISQREYAIQLKAVELGIKPMTSTFLKYAVEKANGKGIWNFPELQKKHDSLLYFELKKEQKEEQRERTRERKKMDLFLATQNLVKG